MKKNKLNIKLSCIILLTFIMSACINDKDIVQEQLESYTINVSVRTGDKLTRASDLIEQEKIKRYDIFIYDKDGEKVVKYLSGTNTGGVEEISASFESSDDFSTDKDIFVIVNNFAWNGNDKPTMEAITKTSLKATELICNQNITGTPGAMTAFGGYKKNSSDNEPFVMSVSQTGYNFRTGGAKLGLTLKRTYAKVILKFSTTLTANQDADWIDLKTIRVREINNVAKTARLFSDDGNNYTPKLESYIYQEGSEYELSAINADLTKGSYTIEPFASDRLALRFFPHDPSADVNSKATSLLIDFEVGPVGSPRVTNRFKRLIKIGDETKDYQIDPNYAYIITIGYGKTTNSITTDCQVVPWNLLSWEDDVESN